MYRIQYLKQDLELKGSRISGDSGVALILNSILRTSDKLNLAYFPSVNDVEDVSINLLKNLPGLEVLEHVPEKDPLPGPPDAMY